MQLNIHNGWLSQGERVASPNFDQRPAGITIDLMVVHNISLPPGEFGNTHIRQLFCNELDCSLHPYFKKLIDLKVSSHCLIERTGKIVQFVSFDDRAWHAGESTFQDRVRCNDFSIGIELEGTDDQAYRNEQYASLVAVTQALMIAYPYITKDCIVGHCDISPGRKTDPGSAFLWKKYREMLS